MAVPYHPLLHAGAALARRVERAEIEFCADAARWSAEAASLAAGGGWAVYCGPGSPLNKVLGLGVGAAVDDADIDAIAAFYQERGEPARVELCPLTAPDLPARLAARGFELVEFENELARVLPMSPDEMAAVEPSPQAVRVARATPDQDPAWVEAVAEGFAAAEDDHRRPSRDEIARVALVMQPFTQPSIARYLVRVGREIAGAGASYLQGGVLGIFGTSTRPRFRRRGVQRALVRHAIAEAGGHADLAIATTAPGSTSQRTFERLGFSVVYTRAILVLPLHVPGHGPARTA
jgi:GNAT superfamily N-acetyltransferase